MPFDRLVRQVDAWAGARNRDDVFAQLGTTDYRPVHLPYVPSLAPAEFRRRFESADVVVGHAGMGTIITAMELRKPLLVMPRRAALSETRNDHQVATARRFASLGAVQVAMDEQELLARLDQLDTLRPPNNGDHRACPVWAGDCPMPAAAESTGRLPGVACPSLIAALRDLAVAELSATVDEVLQGKSMCDARMTEAPSNE